jgi:hypothetical protein
VEIADVVPNWLFSIRMAARGAQVKCTHRIFDWIPFYFVRKGAFATQPLDNDTKHYKKVFFRQISLSAP